jgi:hypothetical protein
MLKKIMNARMTAATANNVGLSIDIIGETTHQFTVRMRVEEPEWQVLHHFKEVLAHQVGGLLPDCDHDATLKVRSDHTNQVDAGQDGKDTRQSREITGDDIVVDQWFQEVRAGKCAASTDDEHDADDNECIFAGSKVCQNSAYCCPDVLGFLERHAGAGAACGHDRALLLFSH